MSRVISGGMVAEKNRVCFFGRRQLEDALEVRDEAHVEHAVGLVDHHDLHAGHQAACRARNGRAGGRAWRSARRRRGPASAPGRRTRRRRSAAPRRASGPWRTSRTTSATWSASSRVGAMTRARGMRALERPAASRSIIGRVKAAVLPVPVWAMPSTSWPARAHGDGLGLDRRGGGVAGVGDGLQGRRATKPQFGKFGHYSLKQDPEPPVLGRAGGADSPDLLRIERLHTRKALNVNDMREPCGLWRNVNGRRPDTCR